MKIISTFLCTLTFLAVALTNCGEDETPHALPVVTTTGVSAITTTSASTGGEVTSDGGSPVVDRGICWSTNPNPTVDDNKISNGTGVGAFTVALESLVENTVYHVRAYATNGVGTAYGVDETFTTNSAQLAVLTTTQPDNVTATTAKLYGEVTSTGGAIVTQRGFCWSTEADPTTNDQVLTVSGELGAMELTAIELVPNTSYHVRAFAINSVGTAYGEDFQFNTLSDLTVPQLIAHYDFNNRSIDVRGNGFDLTLHGTGYTTGRKGDDLGAVYFNGLDTYASGTINFGNSGSMSISAWVYSNNGGYSCMYGSLPGVALTHNMGTMYFTMITGSTNSAYTAMSTGEWHHVVGIYDGPTKTASI